MDEYEFNIISIENHKKERVSLLNHVADVRVDNFNIENVNQREQLANLVSMKCGYHPAGYGVYRHSITLIEGNLYHIVWTTGTTCD